MASIHSGIRGARYGSDLVNAMDKSIHPEAFFLVMEASRYWSREVWEFHQASTRFKATVMRRVEALLHYVAAPMAFERAIATMKFYEWHLGTGISSNRHRQATYPKSLIQGLP